MWTFEMAKEFVKNESNGECELIDIIRKHGRNYIKVKCQCGNTFDTLFYRFKDGKHKCNKCSGKHRYSLDEVKQYVLKNSNCVLLSTTYKNNNEDLIFKCSCGRKFKTTFKRFRLGKKQCDYCINERLANKFSKSHNKFVSEVFNLVGNEYSVIGKYKNTKTKILMRHNKCGCEWYVNSSDFLSKNSRCPKCNESKGEKAVAEWLSSHNISFVHQYKIDDCRKERRLPFDFAVLKNNKLYYLIEYDGKQHYQRGCFGIDTYDKIKQNDKIKNEYCKKENIPLLRIPYKKFNYISTILQNTLL